MEKKLLIVGIDPGTTTAYACLDLKGEIQDIYSAKELKFATLLSGITKIGLPVLVAADKKTAPSMVKNFAAKTGAKLVLPKNDILVKDKKMLTKSRKFANMHEGDALASAIFAFKKNKKTIIKLQRFIEQHRMQEIALKLGKYILADGLSFSAAEKLLKEKAPKRTEKGRIVDEGVGLPRLIKRNKELLEEISQLKIRNRKLQHTMMSLQGTLDKRTRKKFEKIDKEKLRLGIYFKDRQIKGLKKEIRAHQIFVKDLNEEIELLNSIIGNIGDYIVAKQVENLGKESVKRAALSKGDILSVRNAAEYSINALKETAKNVTYIISSKSPIEVKNRFVVLSPKNIKITHTQGLYCFIKTEDFQKSIKGDKLLKKIICEYTR